MRVDPLRKTTAAPFVYTLRRAAPTRVKPWHFLAGLALLLFLRALVYYQIGSAVNWVPNLRLGVIALSFRSDLFRLMILYSVLGFAVALGVFYLWLMFLSLVNGASGALDPLQKLAGTYLGRIDRWPWPIKLVVPLAVGGLAWLLLNPLLAQCRILPPPISAAQRLEQSVVIGLSMYLPWRYIAGASLVLYVLNSYVYLGNHPVWNFVGLTGRNTVAPLRWIPLRVGKVDFAPVLMGVLIFFATEMLERGLSAVYPHLPL